MTPPDRPTWNRPDQPYDFGPPSGQVPPTSAGWPDQDQRYASQGPRYIEPRRRPSWFLRHKILTGLLGILALVLVLTAISAGNPSSAPPTAAGTSAAGKPGATKAKPAAPRKPATSIPGNATVLVNSELQPGTYRTNGPDAELQGLGLPCYWQRSRSTVGTAGDVIANGAPSGPAVVTILPTDVAFTSNGCDAWQRIS